MMIRSMRYDDTEYGINIITSKAPESFVYKQEGHLVENEVLIYVFLVLGHIHHIQLQLLV